MNTETRLSTFAGDRHPDENDLLLALDRELSPEAMAQIEGHLGDCWSCRARSEEMQRGILVFVEYRENCYLPSLEQPPTGFRNFQPQLRSVVAENQPGSARTRFLRAISSLFTLPGSVRWVSAVAAVTVIALVWTQVLFNPEVVSAQDFLTRATAAQNPVATADSGSKRRIIHQKVQIRSGTQAIVRDFEWTAGRTSPQVHWDSQRDVREWDSPLTAEGFAEWRNSLTGKKDRVERSRETLSLVTTAESGWIKAASIVIRKKDFHPVEQHIRFSDDRTLDLFEVAFDVRSESEPKSELAAPAPGAQNHPLTPPNEIGAVPPTELADTELAVRYVIFTEQLDLGEDLQISRAATQVTVSGTASSQERADAIRAALANMENVQVLITSPDSSGRPGLIPGQSAAVKDQVSSTPPLLKEALETAFATHEARIDFVDRCLTASDTALSHAWALKRLVDRYDEVEERRLSPESLRKLREMLRIHLGQLSSANTGVDPVIGLLPGSRSQSPEVPATLLAGIASLLAQVQQQDSLVARLIVGTKANGVALPEAAEKLRSAHRAIGVLARSLEDILSTRQ